MKMKHVGGIIAALLFVMIAGYMTWNQIPARSQGDTSEFIHISRTAGEGFWCSQELSLLNNGHLTSIGSTDHCPTFERTVSQKDLEQIRTIFAEKISTCPESTGSLIDFEETVTVFEKNSVVWKGSAPYGECEAAIYEVENYLKE